MFERFGGLSLFAHFWIARMLGFPDALFRDLLAFGDVEGLVKATFVETFNPMPAVFQPVRLTFAPGLCRPSRA